MTTVEAIIYNQPGAHSVEDRTVLDIKDSRTIFVPVEGDDAVAGVAADLVGEGVRRIELCGALGPRAFAKVRAGVNDEVPVGVCTFGVESVAGANAFEARLMSGERVSVALLFLAEGANPETDEVTTESGTALIRFIPVPDQAAAAEVGCGLVRDATADLVELYRGIGPAPAAEILAAAEGRTPVGMVLYGRQ
ncbi:DUF6506 family protein [Amycolatopsis sp. NPDC059021]|uniref:DUF6506 family protein n=1 Tax=Amycolatopsis sp. NPDC059021 TaxID=3346704 RepID=UPI003671A46B